MVREVLFAVSVLAYLSPASSSAATVGYSGYVFGDGSPVVNGYVIAGTFAAGFDPLNYTCFYGDSACNLNVDAYSSAVADGNFLPIGAGVLTDSSGAFSTTGTTDAAAGTPVWLFAFGDAGTSSSHQVLASSSDPSWNVPAQPLGATLINAVAADLFVMGQTHPLGVEVTGVPVPEPGTWLLALAILINVLSFRGRGWGRIA